MPLIDATDLAAWSNRRDAQAVLPQLLRRLVHATVARPIRVGFPAGEGVQLGGWDGVVVVEQGNAFVPDGASAWELSTTGDIKGKADSDYSKRCANPLGVDPAQSTFVFVTSRRWGGKGDWVAARQSDGMWRQVCAYAADDLEQWLELAPAVRIWLSILLGKRPEDVIDLGEFWADWSAATRPATSAELVLAGRGEVAESVHGWLRDSTPSISLQAESRKEALAVFAAALNQLPPDERVVHLSRAILVRSLTAWHRLTVPGDPLILIPLFDDSSAAITNAMRNGHRVVIPLGQADSVSASTVVIPKLSTDEATKALIANGIPEHRARDLAQLARKSLTSFRRKVAVNPEVEQPRWARPEEARSLLPAMLAGAWDETSDGDKEIIGKLAQAFYGEVNPIFVRWSNEDDPPLRYVGNTWFMLSKEDAWPLLSRYLGRDDLIRFGDVVLEVLGTPDPRYDLPGDQQWTARAFGHAPRHSDELRKSLTDTLAMMGARGATTPISTGITVQDYAAQIARQLLDRANADWRVWASLSLPLLAEAAPDEFLSAVGRGLEGDHPVLLKLFTDQGDTMFSSSPHTGLLWALENLAWSQEYLGRAALLLAKLSRLDPGGKLSNRPQNSLREIFLSWHPQTSAPLDQRLQVLDMIRMREPEVAWQLMHALAPELHGIAHNTHLPQWRDWVSDPSKPILESEHRKTIDELITRMLDDADENGQRWQNLIEGIPSLRGDQYEKVVVRFSALEAERFQAADRALIWDALRRLISQHRSYSDATWALPSDQVDRLEVIFRRFEPQELAARHGWLFSSRPALPEGKDADLHVYEATVDQARLDTVSAIYAQSGVNGIIDFIEHVDQPDLLGFAFGRSEFASGEEDRLLSMNLAHENKARARFARGVAAGRVKIRGREWAEARLAGAASTWSPSQRAELLVCLPEDGRTWDLAEQDPETAHQYWSRVFPFRASDADLERVVKKLIEHGRPYAAVDIIAMHRAPGSLPPVQLAIEALEGVLHAPPDSEAPSHSFAYDAGRLFNIITAADGIDEQRVASLEWAFLPLLGRHEHKPKLLHRELARNPVFFSDVIAVVYRPADEESREVTDEERARANLGHKLLASWRTPPGTLEGGTIDAGALKTWVRTAREALAAKRLSESGDRRIGETLSGSPIGADGIWPHPAVREVIEETASEDIEHGLELGLYNSRGVTSRSLTEGGAQEQQLFDRYTGFATAMRDQWPRTTAMLRRIAERYRRDARREDQRAELREDLND